MKDKQAARKIKSIPAGKTAKAMPEAAQQKGKLIRMNLPAEQDTGPVSASGQAKKAEQKQRF